VSCGTKFLVLLTGLLVAANAFPDTPEVPTPEELEASGAIIGEIIYEKQNVFDPSQPGENKSLYRLANRWHVITRDSVIRNQLLFRSRDQFQARLLDESERILRQNAFLYDASVDPVRYANGTVDILIRTRDLWTLMPGLSVSRSGGENRTRFSLSERNLLGRGVSLRLSHTENVDRDSTSFQYFDKNLGRSWTSLFLGLADNSDGETADLRLVRPFYALDARWSAGGTFFDDAREVSFYELGEEAAEYQVESNTHKLFYGWSGGLRNGWTRRWTAGFVYDDRQFSTVDNGELPPLVPENRRLAYPFIGVEILEDRFEATSNRDQIERTEDFFLGTRLWASLGYADEAFGADRQSLLYRVEASRGFGSIRKKALLFSATVDGRLDDGDSANAQVTASARFYNQITDKRLFFMIAEARHGRALDLDNYAELGGDNGLRGYPLRYQTGESKFLLTAEQRYFTDWYPFKLVRVGGALFADIGRTWGESPLGERPVGWLKDVGFGLRLVPTRASGRDVIHIDVAFPLDGDSSIDDVQLLIESKRSF
jgi:outer membrane protein assembly factor BamA